MGASINPQKVGRFVLREFKDSESVTIDRLLKKMKAARILPKLGGGAAYMDDDDARELALYINWGFWFGRRDSDIIEPISAGRGRGYPKVVESFLSAGVGGVYSGSARRKFHAVKWTLTLHARFLPFRDLPLHPGYGDF